MSRSARLAYFSMEIMLHEELPTYSGGLGVLAGDFLRSTADTKLPMVAVTLLHRKGYFSQGLDGDGSQHEFPVEWSPERLLVEHPEHARVQIAGRTVWVRAWQFTVQGSSGGTVPVYLLDTDLPENSEWDRHITDQLYGGDSYYRLAQETVLGIGGVRMLRSLGYNSIERFHMNEGHSSLLTVELLDEQIQSNRSNFPLAQHIEKVRSMCAFTTHTPVPAGHDQFSLDTVKSVLGEGLVHQLSELLCCNDKLNMTFLGFTLSHYINGVAKRHGQVSRELFANYTIDSITNGVHAATWVAPAFTLLFDRHIEGWRSDNASLRYALSFSDEELWSSHQMAKQELLREIARRLPGIMLDREVLTLGFARRMTAYKRPELLLTDLDWLRKIGIEAGGLQIVYAGKAHPHDTVGKEIIRKVVGRVEKLAPEVRLVFLPNYDIELAKLLVAGVDVWVNTPEPPKEASGTSGMKAALNGVPSLSVLDGWWIEGCIEGKTGWSVGSQASAPTEQRFWDDDARSLYEKLEQVIVPLYCRDRAGFIDVMRHAIGLNGSFFNTERMVKEYLLKAYFG